jgi:hypothetical protein
MKHAAYFGTMLVLGSSAGGARAFSEPTLYMEQTIHGGGGGRFFTGAPLDAYTCAVCHDGGEKPQVQIDGFPERFEPGSTYEVSVRWTQPASPHALNLEIVDADGRAAGKLALPADSELDEDDRCVLAEDEGLRDVQASYLMESGARTVVGVRGCGARSLHFSFTAPSATKVALTASILRTDGSEDQHGDGVLEVRRLARSVGAPAEGPVVGSCAMHAGSRLGDWSGAVALWLVALWRRRRSAPR